MNARNVGYWVSTGLVAVAFGLGGVMDLSGSPQVVASITHLGYPVYLAGLLGVWKLLGAIAVLAPGNARLKEWAYAGMFFDLTGAAYSHTASGDPAGAVLTPLIVLGLVAASWALRPEGRALPRAASADSVPSVATGSLLGAKG
jgi:uncharacterized membrane protein YphA (DoxX/SURF4 family)